MPKTPLLTDKWPICPSTSLSPLFLLFYAHFLSLAKLFTCTQPPPANTSDDHHPSSTIYLTSQSPLSNHSLTYTQPSSTLSISPIVYINNYETLRFQIDQATIHKRDHPSLWGSKQYPFSPNPKFKFTLSLDGATSLTDMTSATTMAMS